ncbi:hypothetical protein LBMAG42_29430 [Deltaproteobacteria bacterium]|nr:hypothetical protein LBMAG42_29430 [Deltaproteobacteria bacterium]
MLVAGTLIVGLFARAPGDAIDTLENGDSVRATLESEWGLGGSFLARVGTGMARLSTGDFGESLTYKPGVPVLDLVRTGVVTSAQLLLPATLLGLVLAFGAAALAGGAGGSALARIMRLLSGISALPLVLGALAAVNGVNAATWALLERGLIDRPSWFALPEEPGLVRTGLAIALLGFGSARFAQLTRRARSMLAVLDSAPFVAAERARGGPLVPLYARHLLVPTLRLAADTLPALFAGLIVVERAFHLPGAGTSFWESCAHRDWPLAAGLALAFAAGVVGLRLLSEAVAVVVDPREREALA